MKTFNGNAIRATALSFAFLAGISGIMSGTGLIRQGHIVPETLWVSFIGPSYINYQDTAYSVLTIVPSFYWTGVLAVITSIVSTFWAVKYLHTKAGPSVMLVLVVIQALVGGGWVPDLGLVTCVLAKGINSPLDWWRKRISIQWQRRLAGAWGWSIGVYWILSVLLLLFTVMGVNDAVVLGHVLNIAGLMIIPIPLMILGAISRELINPRHGGELPLPCPQLQASYNQLAE
ncbi:MAG: hypothetical protein NWF07_13930 [Candidatus Bathyarchaeota archaeon]|nr:hypothetical protein [Candidatus Bathyarchaeota archaeon]